jgi:hypothetical protein
MRAWLDRFVRTHLILDDPDPQPSRLDLLDRPTGQ